MAVIIDDVVIPITKINYISLPVTPIQSVPEVTNLITQTNYLTSLLYNTFTDEFQVFIASGSLRVGGDAPIGIVTLNGSPVSRIVDLFDREEKVLIATTTSSAIDGSFSFMNLSNRVYDIIIRGNIGERDIIVAKVTPVS